MLHFLKKLFNSNTGIFIAILLFVIVNFLASINHSKIDLTKEKRYTLSQATKSLVKSTNDNIYIEVFLKGEFPSGFKKLAESAQEFLELLKDQNRKVEYKFISPQEKILGTETLYGDTLVSLGATPINLKVQKETGENSNIIFPNALIHYKNKTALVNLFSGAKSNITQEEINSAEALMEYQFANTLNKLMQENRPSIGYTVGNGQPTDARTFDMAQTLKNDFNFFTFNINQHAIIPSNFDAIIIAKPTETFTENEKLKIDQYLMNGGKLLLFIDNLHAETDSITLKRETIAYDRNLNLTDLFFKYGFRINNDLIMDLQCDVLPFIVGGKANNPQYAFLHWNYYPFLIPNNEAVLNKNLGYVSAKFVNSIDTIQTSHIKKTPLLFSSSNSRNISTPALISLNENKDAPQNEKFNRSAILAGLLLQGNFTSAYANRISQSQLDTLNANNSPFLANSTSNAKIIVVADGDIIFNEVDNESGPLPMGYNKYTFAEYRNQTENGKYFFPVANHDFFINSIEYLTGNAAIAETRNKDIVLRLLDTKKIKANKLFWQIINIVVPIFLIIVAGIGFYFFRKKKYAA